MTRRLVWIVAFATFAACADATPGVRGIRLEAVTTLGASSGPGAMPGLPTAYAQTAAGRYLLAVDEAPAPELIRVYDSVGRFVQSIGRLGNGPGEYQRPAFVVALAGDSVLVVDNQSRRLTILDAALRFVRAAPFPSLVSGAVATPAGELFINAPFLVRDAEPQIVTRVGTDGSFRGALDGDSVVCRRTDCAWRGARVLAGGGHGEVWVSHRYFRYEIERFDSAGHRTKHFVLVADWFPPYDSLVGPTPTRAPLASVMAMTLDDAGRLWILGQAANPHWARTLGPERRGEGGRQYFPIGDPTKAFDGVIEVRDTSDGHLIATRRTTNEPYWVVIGRKIGRVRSDGDGWGWVDVVSPSIVQ